MRSISIYQRKGYFYACPNAHTEHGLGIVSGPCIKLPLKSTSDNGLGEAALQTLERAGAIVPHPTDWSALPPSPVLESAGVKNWRTFCRGALNVHVVLLEDELILTPTRKAARQGFDHLDDDELHLPTTPSAEEMGEAIQQALALCR